MSALFPLYLLGLVGLLLPWILHRFSFHQPPEQDFPSALFLEATKPPATSKRKLRHKVLFALRWLALLLLCALFAQLWLRSDNTAVSSDTTQLLIVDTSFSMRSGDIWDKTLAMVRDELGTLDSDTAYQLLSAAGQLIALTDITTDKANALSALNALQPGYQMIDYGELMQRINQLAGDIKTPVFATFFSDAQRSNLPAQTNRLLANRLAGFTHRVVESNIDAVNYRVSAEAHTSDRVNARVQANVSASSASNNSDSVQKTISVLHDGNELSARQVSMQPGETLNVIFESIALPASDNPILTVRINGDDALVDDNQQNVTVHGLSPIEIALSGIGSEMSTQAAAFVSTAVETDLEVDVRRVPVNNAAAGLNTQHAIVFATLDASSAIPAEIASYVAGGGNVLLVRKQHNEDATSELDGSPLGYVDQAHPLGLDTIDWQDTRFFELAPMKLLNNDLLLLATAGGVPVLVERTSDEGTLLLLNDNLDGLISDLPVQPAFVVLVRRIVDYFIASSVIPDVLNAGGAISLPPNTQLLDPSGDAMLGLADLGRGNETTLNEPGLYSVLGANQTKAVKVIIDAAESNLVRIPQQQLSAWQTRHEVANEPIAEADAAASSANSTSDSGSSLLATEPDLAAKRLWQYVIMMLLLCVFIESLMANRLLWVRRDS